MRSRLSWSWPLQHLALAFRQELKCQANEHFAISACVLFRRRCTLDWPHPWSKRSHGISGIAPCSGKVVVPRCGEMWSNHFSLTAGRGGFTNTQRARTTQHLGNKLLNNVAPVGELLQARCGRFLVQRPLKKIAHVHTMITFKPIYSRLINTSVEWMPGEANRRKDQQWTASFRKPQPSTVSLALRVEG